MDDTSGGSTTLFSEITGDESNMGSSKGVSDFDRTHRLMINSTYEIPRWGFGWNNTAIGKRFFAGWQISGIGLWQSGAPFSITDSAGAVFYGTTGSRANYAPGATAQSARKSGSPQSRLNAYFDTTAFARAGNLFGNVGRNTMRGPRQRNVDFSVNKRLLITERLNLELRGEFFNALNMVNFASPTGSIASSGFGGIKATEGNPRVIQFAMKLAF
jgi:hypothetical protein